MQCYKQDAQRRATITSRYRQALLQEVSSPVRWRHPGEPQQHMAAGDLESAGRCGGESGAKTVCVIPRRE
jgi:hypothetical protein